VGIYVKELKSVLQLNVLSLDDKSDKTEAYWFIHIAFNWIRIYLG
jgi:hypothetical protein